MRMFFRMNGKKAEDDPDLAEMLKAMEEGFDGTNRAYLEPVLVCIRQL